MSVFAGRSGTASSGSRRGVLRVVQSRVLRVVNTQGRGFGIDYDEPEGDPGLFGPDSVAWRIHADFPGMMAGGLCALMLQTLHPLALAGVWDHSDFRRDLLGRLRRTSAFVAATTFAPLADAQRQIERVRAIHRNVHGVAADGRSYSAEDPALLTWVHCTEMWSFLNGYRRYRHRELPRAVQDRYYEETRRVAEALGARDVPGSAGEVDEYFRAVQPELLFDARSREVLEVLNRARLPVLAAGMTRAVFLGAGAVLLPPWARRLMGRGRSRRVGDLVAAGTLDLAAPLLRAAMRDGAAARSCRRLGVDPAVLYHWLPEHEG